MATQQAISTDRTKEAGAGARTAAHAEQTVTVRRSPEEVYALWKNFENFPRFMSNLAEVYEIDSRRSHWTVFGPAHRRVDWIVEIVDDRPNESIAWRSVEGSDIEDYGYVRFRRAPGGRGTEVTASFSYDPRGGGLAGKEDLYRFRQYAETGEVAVSHNRRSAK